MAHMTEEWVSFWYQCLSQNIDYSLYCNAREANETKKCKEFENRFEKIAQIYDDFGTLDGWPEDGMNSELWREWFVPRKHLFMPSVQIIPNTSAHVLAPGHILIDVQLQKDAAATMELITGIINSHYKEHSVVPHAPPKYSLYLKNGRLAHGYEKVRQACVSVSRSYRYDSITFEELRHVDAVTAFIRGEIDNLGWELDRVARKELDELGILSEQRLDSYRTMLNRCRRDFQGFAKNAIRGRFPDDSAFDSEVQDFF